MAGKLSSRCFLDIFYAGQTLVSTLSEDGFQNLQIPVFIDLVNGLRTFTPDWFWSRDFAEHQHRARKWTTALDQYINVDQAFRAEDQLCISLSDLSP